MEKQPISRLTEIQQRDTVIGFLIDKRQGILQNAPSWNITREDPDIEAAARNHARRLVEETIPGSIGRLEQRRMDLEAERATYLQEHAPELIAQAKAFETDIMRERKIVERLSRDLQRGFTTQEVVDRRTAALQSLESRKETDLDLQAGFELLTQQRQTATSHIAESPIDGVQVEPVEALPGDVIPSLLPQLDHITSIHEHKYNIGNTVSTRAIEAEALDPDKRSEEQRKLLEAIQKMNKFTEAVAWKQVYSPEELYALVEKLELFSQKNRPDFDGVEGQILEILERKMYSLDDRNQESIKGLLKRANGERKRKGMQWSTLNSVALTASVIIRENMTASYERSQYLIPVRDPEPQIYPDLTGVYQFVADIHTYDMIGRRSINVDKARQESFVENCRVANEWFESVRPLLEALRDNPDTKRKVNIILEMVESMNKRLEGGQVYGQWKDYKIDPAGAISLQKKIGHTVEQLKAQINALAQPEVDEGKIVPLE